jgi:hypothetical protein
VEKLAEIVTRHPWIVGATVTVLGAGFILNVYKIGFAHAQVCAAVAGAQRAASEALGG